MQDKSHYTRYNYKKLYELAVEMFIRYGFSREDSEKVADVILTSDRFGVESHGVNRLTLYPFGIDIGRIKVDAKPEVVEDRLSMADHRRARRHGPACQYPGHAACHRQGKKVRRRHGQRP